MFPSQSSGPDKVPESLAPPGAALGPLSAASPLLAAAAAGRAPLPPVDPLRRSAHINLRAGPSVWLSDVGAAGKRSKSVNEVLLNAPKRGSHSNPDQLLSHPIVGESGPASPGSRPDSADEDAGRSDRERAASHRGAGSSGRSVGMALAEVDGPRGKSRLGAAALKPSLSRSGILKPDAGARSDKAAALKAPGSRSIMFREANQTRTFRRDDDDDDDDDEDSDSSEDLIDHDADPDWEEQRKAKPYALKLPGDESSDGGSASRASMALGKRVRPLGEWRLSGQRAGGACC